MILLAARPIGLYGLTQMTDFEIGEMSFEELSQLIDDLAQVRNVQRRLPGVKFCDAEERVDMTREQLAQLVMDVKSAATRLNLS